MADDMARKEREHERLEKCWDEWDRSALTGAQPFSTTEKNPPVPEWKHQRPVKTFKQVGE